MKIIFIKFGLLGIISSVLGSFLSLGLGWIISSFYFDGIWSFSPTLTISTVLGLTILSMMTGLLGSWRVLQIRPNVLLRD